jgi:hypothetical protein
LKKSNDLFQAPNDPALLYNVTGNRDQSKKADGQKLRMELIPTSAYIGLGRVLTHGAEKYGPNTWQDVEYERYIGALIRHLIAFIDDPTGVDSDSGLKHTEHLLANAVFLNDCVAAGRIPTDERP